MRGGGSITRRVMLLVSMTLSVVSSCRCLAATSDTQVPQALQTVQSIDAHGDLHLASGEVAHLRGIQLGDAGGLAALHQLADGKTLRLLDAVSDRYGRIAADLYIDNDKQASLQERLVEAGQAFVYSPLGDEPHLASLLAHEASARAAQRGIWGKSNTTYADIPADDADQAIGRFAFIRGTVVEAARVKNMVYLNFGADHHRDFTVAIRAGDLKLFRKAKIDPLDYQGQTLRVRGWVTRRGGALINVTTPAQITLLPRAAQ